MATFQVLSCYSTYIGSQTEVIDRRRMLSLDSFTLVLNVYISVQQHEWVSSFVRLSPFTEQRVPRLLAEWNARTEVAFES